MRIKRTQTGYHDEDGDEEIEDTFKSTIDRCPSIGLTVNPFAVVTCGSAVRVKVNVSMRVNAIDRP
ncbi:hypothetical protein DICSQDRAFT_176185 [Dichomitus squalens LYAD-421 SS1]|uniref:Uncharacterized protein n=1 Tax=Dichomitus squalens (strain LYAD-421) TaxID=732165 RepID=R7SGJ5_DICSQ|nr:uncharacterized protein DICSQDRAFT_176185 [Dichomitus squalens LYAD-421 SS1]EJF55261.1 hypothetical protein DICSQDRAFT_176185 [Dichomitus squalens LYAD-421 SS1]